jgi:hypothetical protein
MRPVYGAACEAAVFADRLVPGEQLQAVFWCSHRYPWPFETFVVLFDWLTFVMFSSVRTHEFCALTDRRVLFLKSNAFRQPYRDRFEESPRASVRCTWFLDFLGVWVDLKVDREPRVRRLRVDLSDSAAARACLTLR